MRQVGNTDARGDYLQMGGVGCTCACGRSTLNGFFSCFFC